MTNQPEKWVNHQAHAEKIIQLTRHLPAVQREIIYRHALADKTRRLARSWLPLPIMRTRMAAAIYLLITVSGPILLFHGAPVVGAILYFVGLLLLIPCIWNFSANLIERQADALSYMEETIVDLPLAETFKVSESILADIKARPELIDKNQSVVVGKINDGLKSGSTISIKSEAIDEKQTRCHVTSVTTNQYLFQLNKKRVQVCVRKLQESVAIHQLLLEG